MSLATYPKYGHAEAEEGLDVRHFWTILRKRKATFLQIFVLVLVVGAAATVLSKPVYQARAKLLVPATSRDLNLVSGSDPITNIINNVSPESVSTQIQLIQNRTFVKKAMEAAKITNTPGIIRPSVKVDQVRDSNIIQITVESGKPEVAAKLANTLLELHLEDTNTFRTSGFDKSFEMFKKETEKARLAMEGARERLAAFRNSHPVASVEADQLARQQALVTAQSNAVDGRANVASTRGRSSASERDLPACGKS